jgi:5-methylcytosine-specific restriction endonuclease McrA
VPALNLDLDYFTHPKIMRLAGMLGPYALALPIRLWCHAAKHHCETGKLEGYSKYEVESVSGWTGAPGDFVDAMVKIKLLDEIQGGYAIHDWLDHAGHLGAFKKRGKAANKKRWKDLAKANKATRSERLRLARQRGKHTVEQWEALKAYFDHTCVRCNEPSMNVEKDHIVPLYLDGSDAIENIQPVCAKCNASKTGDIKDYRITYLINSRKAATAEEAERLLKGVINHTKMTPLNQSHPIPSNPAKHKVVQTPPAAPSGFDVFWKLYPRKKSKGDAKRAWSKLKPNEPLQDRILRALERAKTSDDWTKDAGKYIPYPASWLNAEGWEDEPTKVVPIRLQQPARTTIVLGPNDPAPVGEPCPPEVADILSKLTGKIGSM